MTDDDDNDNGNIRCRNPQSARADQSQKSRTVISDEEKEMMKGVCNEPGTFTLSIFMNIPRAQ